jgi:hypothetical protein
MRCLILVGLLFLMPALEAGGRDSEQKSVEVDGVQIPLNGTLRSIEGVPVLTLRGTPWEQGFAHGYLLCDRILRFFNDFVSKDKGRLSAEEFEALRWRTSIMEIPSQFETEMRGMLEGMEARSGGPVYFEALDRTLRYRDLVMANCMGDISRFTMQCSSFAAWGSMTGDGQTVAGRNYEWPRYPAMIGAQVIVVRSPPPGSDTLSSVSLFFPGLIGVITAMNEEGVTVSTQDSSCSNPLSMRWGFAPITLLYRQALESARAETAEEDMAHILKEHFTITGNNLFVTRPYTGEESGGFVFEHDGCLEKGDGMTLRVPEAGDAFLVCTNRFYERALPSTVELKSCSRFDKLNRQLEQIKKQRRKDRVTLEEAWTLAESVPIQSLAIYHRVIFEPNKRLMHVAFPEKGEPIKRITLEVAKLIDMDQGEASSSKK